MSNTQSTGTFVWFEYVSGDLSKAKGFYGELFGWTAQAIPMPDGPYDMIASGGRTIGGYLKTPKGAPPEAHWLSHLSVADAKATSEQIASLGGKVLKPATKIGEFGTMAIVADLHGAPLALWQPTKSEAQPEPTANTFCWNELASDHPAASVKFYGEIAGLTGKRMDMPTGEYHVLERDGRPVAGVMAKAMADQPNAWLPYVQVTSADKTVEKAKKLGGDVIVPPTDIPNVGRFAVLTDSQGAAIGILQP